MFFDSIIKSKIKSSFKAIKKDQGASLVEYGLVVALVSIVSISSIIAFSNQLGPLFCKVISGLDRLKTHEKVWNGHCCPPLDVYNLNQNCLNLDIDWDAIGIPSPCLEPEDLC